MRSPQRILAVIFEAIKQIFFYTVRAKIQLHNINGYINGKPPGSISVFGGLSAVWLDVCWVYRDIIFLGIKAICFSHKTLSIQKITVHIYIRKENYL